MQAYLFLLLVLYVAVVALVVLYFPHFPVQFTAHQSVYDVEYQKVLTIHNPGESNRLID